MATALLLQEKNMLKLNPDQAGNAELMKTSLVPADTVEKPVEAHFHDLLPLSSSSGKSFKSLRMFDDLRVKSLS